MYYSSWFSLILVKTLVAVLIHCLSVLLMAPFLGSAHLLVAWISTASSLHGTALDILTQHPDYNKTVVSLLSVQGKFLKN